MKIVHKDGNPQRFVLLEFQGFNGKEAHIALSPKTIPLLRDGLDNLLKEMDDRACI